MSHPLFADTITLYHKESDSYTRFILQGVQWRQKTERQISSNLSTAGVMLFQTVTTVTIPASITAAKNISPTTGDVLILGRGPLITENYPVSSLKADHVTYCTVRSVSDNTLRPMLKHWKVYAV